MARHRAPLRTSADKMRSRPDDVTSGGGAFVKGEPDPVPSAPASNAHAHAIDEDEDGDPVVRVIDVYISPALSDTLHLLQFPIQPAPSARRQSASSSRSGQRRDAGHSDTPAEARFRPKHRMLELEYPIPSSAQGAQRQLPDKMCLSQRAFASNSIAPVTHMALAKMSKDGERLNVIPLRRHVLQMRPSFRHLHEDDDDDEPVGGDDYPGKRAGKQRPVMFQKKESERSAEQRRSSYAHKRAIEEGEEWIDLEVHGSGHGRGRQWTALRTEAHAKTKCQDKGNELRFAANPKFADEEDGGYVKSLNYLDGASLVRSSGGEAHVENLSDWAPTAAPAAVETANDDDMETESLASSAEPTVGAAERATAELASKLAVLLQNGNGTMVPYRVLRSRFRAGRVPDGILTAALSSCAVLVRGNFSLKSNLAKFLTFLGGGEGRKRVARELRDLILLLLNMHGMVQRERLARAYSVKAETASGYDAITTDTITFILETVARKSNDCWVAKVEDDEEFAADFPEVAACHGVYWMKKKDMMMDLIELYENAEVDDPDTNDFSEGILDNTV